MAVKFAVTVTGDEGIANVHDADAPHPAYPVQFVKENPLFAVAVTAIDSPDVRCDVPFGSVVPPIPASTANVWEDVASCAEQSALVPPLLPLQLHVQGPLPLTALGAPTAQRLAAGALVNRAPDEEPQAPFIGTVALSVVTENGATKPPTFRLARTAVA